MNKISSNYIYATPQRQNNSISFGNKAQKLSAQFLTNSKNLTGKNAVVLLKRLGYSVKETGSSHHVFRDSKGNIITLALHKGKQQLKPYQIKNVATAIENASRFSTFA